MEVLHTYLREGRYRKIEAFVLSAAYLALLYMGSAEWKNSLSSFFKIASAVISAAGVVAYNLRNRVVDFSIKRIAEKPNYFQQKQKTKRCCRRLTYIVFWSFITAIACMIAGLCDSVTPSNAIMVATAGVMFSSLMVYYLHIIFAFDELESFILNEAVQDREERDKKQQTANILERKEKYPDN